MADIDKSLPNVKQTLKVPSQQQQMEIQAESQASGPFTGGIDFHFTCFIFLVNVGFFIFYLVCIDQLQTGRLAHNPCLLHLLFFFCHTLLPLNIQLLLHPQ